MKAHEIAKKIAHEEEVTAVDIAKELPITLGEVCEIYKLEGNNSKRLLPETSPKNHQKIAGTLKLMNMHPEFHLAFLQIAGSSDIVVDNLERIREQLSFLNENLCSETISNILLLLEKEIEKQKQFL